MTRKPHCCCWLYHWTEHVRELAGADTVRLKVCRKIVQSAYWTLVPCPGRRSGRKLQKLFPSMDLSQFFTEVKRRNTHALAVAYVTAGLLLIELAAILLAIFEAALPQSRDTPQWRQFTGTNTPT